MRPICVIALSSLFLLATSSAPAQEWGSLKGTVVLAGSNPIKQEFLNVDKDKASCLTNGPIPKDELLVNEKNRGVRWAVIWIAKDKAGTADHKAELPTHPSLKAIKDKVAVMDQPCCRFEPHVLTMRKGQKFLGKNSAGIPHNMRVVGTGPNRDNSVNILLGPNSEKTIGDEPWLPHFLPSQVSCDIHSWMRAYVFVFAHPYFATTDENGAFEIKNAPAGKHRLIIWHPASGWVVKDGEKPGKEGVEVTIEADKTTDLGKMELKVSE